MTPQNEARPPLRLPFGLPITVRKYGEKKEGHESHERCGALRNAPPFDFLTFQEILRNPSTDFVELLGLAFWLMLMGLLSVRQ